MSPTTLNTARSDMLVDPAWIRDHLEDPAVRLVEVDVSPTAYEAGHIPGAVLWNAYSDLRRPDYSPITSAELAKLLSRSGIDPSSTIVLYGYGAYLGFWLMKRSGHERVVLMDGPRERWEQAGLRWTPEITAAVNRSYPRPQGDQTVIASREEVTALIDRSAGLILDVRSREEFEGERFWPSGATEHTGRAGHIPGAVHLPFDLLLDADRRLKSPSEIGALCDAHGIEADRRVVTYCTIGNRASLVWFALKHLLEFPDVAVYYGSWVQWGKLPGAPVQTS